MGRYKRVCGSFDPFPVSVCLIALTILAAAGASTAGTKAIGEKFPRAAALVSLEAWTDSVEAASGKPDITLDEMKSILERETGEPVIEGTEWRRRKNPRVAMLCALACPGLGQIYNEKPFKAAIALGFESWYMGRIIHYYREEKRETRIRDSYPKWKVSPIDSTLYISSDWKFYDAWVEEYKARKIDWIWWLAGVKLVTILDAYIDAHLNDMRFRIEEVGGEDSAGISIVFDF